jgi:hypothetical protein
MGVDEYKNEYGEMATTKVMHVCKICKAEFLHSNAIMKKHLKRCHNVSVLDYYMVRCHKFLLNFHGPVL